MNNILNEMECFKDRLDSKEAINKLVAYYGNKFYVVILMKQYERLLANIRSINVLLNINSIEDAYTIFRKYLETYLIIMSIYENKGVVKDYLIHDSYIGLKACGEKNKEIREFIRNKPEGFLEYGYLEDVLDTSENGFKYTIKAVCKAAHIDEYYKWYRLCNNFVHNNLSSVNINQDEGRDKLIEKCCTSFLRLKQAFEKIL